MSSIRPWRDIERRKSRQIMVGSVPVGGDAPITVQTMTNTPTEDAQGDDRPDPPLRGGRRRHHPRVLPDRGGDRGAEGDRPRGQRADRRRHPFPLQARARSRRRRRRLPAHQPGQHRLRRAGPRSHRRGRANGCAIRIGVNAGSLEKDLLEKYGEPCPEALVESALDHIRILEDHDFREYKVAVKASDVFLAVAAYQQLADAVDCPLHLGITEAGGLIGGTVKSAIGMGNLLWAGIGDTIRVSLSAEPEEEVRVGYEILKALGIRSRGVRVVSCPSCARQGFDVIRTVEALEERLQHIKTPMSLSVLGCVVTAPAKRARPTSASPAAATASTWSICRRHRPSRPGRRHDRSHRPAGRSEGRRDRSRRGRRELTLDAAE